MKTQQKRAEVAMNKNRLTIFVVLTLALGISLAAVARALAEPDPADANANLAFDKLKTLVGTWEAPTDRGTAVVTYRLVSGGTALLEDAKMPGEAEMITVYYVDGKRLLMTHYCTAGNQPRMQAAAFDPKSDRIDFQFVDATNLRSPDDGHMHHVVFEFRGPNQVNENWTFYKDAKPALTEPLAYYRAQ
jgi:hypothetical protein